MANQNFRGQLEAHIRKTGNTRELRIIMTGGFGPEHNRLFRMEVSIGHTEYKNGKEEFRQAYVETGLGKTKRRAINQACEKIWQIIGGYNDRRILQFLIGKYLPRNVACHLLKTVITKYGGRIKPRDGIHPLFEEILETQIIDPEECRVIVCEIDKWIKPAGLSVELEVGAILVKNIMI